jgi:hypothetical protein
MKELNANNAIAATDFDIVGFDTQTVESENTVGLPELAASIGEVGCCTVTVKPSAK